MRSSMTAPGCGAAASKPTIRIVALIWQKSKINYVNKKTFKLQIASTNRDYVDIRDYVGVGETISEGCCPEHPSSCRAGGWRNHRSQDLSAAIRVALYEEIFHGSKPVLAGASTPNRSSYCYLLAALEHRGASRL